MSRHRDFDAARAENVGDPLTFRLAGRDFTVTRLPAGPLLDLANDADLEGAAAFAAFSKFLLKIVADEHEDEMRAALNESDLMVVFDVVRWVIEESTARPLSEQASVPVLQSPNGAASKLAAVTEGWTPSE